MPTKQGPSIIDLVKPYIKYRAFVKFHDGKHRHFYGRETSTTVAQVQWKIVTEIILDRLAGWHDLVTMIETGYCAGRFDTATIFSRNAPGAPFNQLHRHYIAGQLNIDSQNDPVIEEAHQYYKLYPVVQEHSRQIRILTPEELHNLQLELKKIKK